jgi:hypothetical protein
MHERVLPMHERILPMHERILLWGRIPHYMRGPAPPAAVAPYPPLITVFVMQKPRFSGAFVLCFPQMTQSQI